MGKKIPMWQCLLVMVVLLVLLFWGIMVDTDAAEGHVALILAGAFAAVIAAFNGWKWQVMEQGILAAINRCRLCSSWLLWVSCLLHGWSAELSLR